MSEPIGPDDLTIMTPNGAVAEPESWSALVYSVLREPGGFLIVNSGPSDMYAQAVNHEGRFLLEYRDGSPDQHFQAKYVAFASIVDACRNGCVVIEPSSTITRGNSCRSN